MRKPVDILVDRLAEKVREDPSGAKSLSHVLVIVPTAQSGRRLRFKLAERLGALIPPAVTMPARLFDTELPVATRTDELVAFWTAKGGKDPLALAAQLSDIRGILGANALSFADVAERIGDLLTGDLADVERARWRNLAEVETNYLAALAARGKVDNVEAMKRAIAEPPHFPEIEEIVIGYVLEPLPAMRRLVEAMQARDGLRVEEIAPDEADGPLPLTRRQITCFGTAAAESERIADLFAAVGSDESLPALCLADPELFPEVQGCLQAKGLHVHDPSRTKLVTSSLGHLAAQIASLVRTRSYAVFSAFVRGGDVRRWLCEELKMTPAEMTAALVDLDNRQRELLPEKIDDIAPKTQKRLRAIFEFVGVQLRKKTLRGILQAIFRAHTLDTHDADSREFAAAAEALNGIIDECFEPSVPQDLAWELFSRRLEEATYSLEPDEGDVVMTDGWLELPYLDADELVIAGFAEGCVPESVVGHAFLPDSLRRGLGLPDNESRARRDEAIFRLALGCRAENAVRVSFHAVSACGDVLKPSRLLFLTDDDAELAARAKRFYSLHEGTDETPVADLPVAWRLKLPFPPEQRELAHASPTSLDAYRTCPFSYFLKKTFGEREDDRAEELDPSEFGNLAHEALELWGKGDLADSEDAPAIAARLGEHVDALLGERFGTAVPAIVALQGESLKRRLVHFAEIQSDWHSKGWRILATERKLEVMLGHTRLHGRCDRIDYCAERNEWCVIDYKTWDSPEKQKAGLQLPIYCSMLDADGEFPEATRAHISSVYCIIGKNREATQYSPPAFGSALPEAEREVRSLIDRIERGIFWPPNLKEQAWRWDFSDVVGSNPVECVDPQWIDDQERRVREYDDRH